MDLRRSLFLIPFLDSTKPVSKQKLFVEYSLLTDLSLSSFNHVLFELRAFKVLSLEKRGFFEIDKKQFKEYIFLYKDVEHSIKTLKLIKPDWCKKWGKTLDELLS